ncbi:hypothetical protein LSH36_908g01053 [Paralvinella palmiformis]|uniref:Calponin n=1 Tax=Paralvinella palmiformis TaxID=53620 RepID=A0AAD9IZ97_9ANNE|nr:hypothetical protein LSH36_908g01053 [Paralvinella palmiformis]
MANRPRGYGLTAEIKNKMASKYDEDMEREARDWMEAVVGEPLKNMSCFHLRVQMFWFLSSKRLANILRPPVKFNTSGLAFKQMENIGKFLDACEKYGLMKTDLFQTVDLYEAQNMWQVVLCIHALGRKAQVNGFDGPALGPKEAQKNVREFTEGQLRAGEGIIGLQAGTNKVASQSGMSFGTQRHINDIKIESATPEGQNIIGLQMGTNAGATQSGLNFGKPRGINAPNL